jgi:hypothetical protein
MVWVELNPVDRILTMHAVIITYGHASGERITKQIAEEIETLWNEPAGRVFIQEIPFQVKFRVGWIWDPEIEPETIITNLDPARNFYRIESYAEGNISFVDGLGSNTGYFKEENLYRGSTTAAHEFGHGLGLDHPRDLDYRGRGRPGIMYPRGTWVDPSYQYDSTARPGNPGGTMHPMHRRVRQEDIDLLKLNRLRFERGFSIKGSFTNVYHTDHASFRKGGIA